MPFFVIFIIIPLIELAIFAAVSDEIGLGTTLLFALLTALIGGNIVRMQGVQTLTSIRTSMNDGRMPTAEIFDGFCLVAAGALLITPGFFTDTLGFILLVPAFRAFVRKMIKEHTNLGVDAAGFQQGSPYDPTIIEGEYEDLDEKRDSDEDEDKPRLS